MNVIISLLSSTVLQLSWRAPAEESRNGIIRQYLVNLKEIQTGRLLTYTATTTSISVQSLHPAYTYNCTVSAYTITAGPFSPTVTITMPEDGMLHCLILSIRFTILSPPQLQVGILKTLV